MATYQKQYDKFIRTEVSTFSDSVNQFQDAKILGHTLQTYELMHEFEESLAVCSGGVGTLRG